MEVDPIFAFQGHLYKDFCNIDGRDWLYFFEKKKGLRFALLCRVMAEERHPPKQLSCLVVVASAAQGSDSAASSKVHFAR